MDSPKLRKLVASCRRRAPSLLRPVASECIVDLKTNVSFYCRVGLDLLSKRRYVTANGVKRRRFIVHR